MTTLLNPWLYIPSLNTVVPMNYWHKFCQIESDYHRSQCMQKDPACLRILKGECKGILAVEQPDPTSNEFAALQLIDLSGELRPESPFFCYRLPYQMQLKGMTLSS